jgi:hypothetical protein
VNVLQMNLWIVAVFSAIAVASVLLLTIIVKYLGEKAVNRQFIRDQVFLCIHM